MKQLINERAYERVIALFVKTLSPVTHTQFTSVLADSLKRTWQVVIVFAVLSFLLVIFEKEIRLRQDLDTEFGLVKKKKSGSSNVAEEGKHISVAADEERVGD